MSPDDVVTALVFVTLLAVSFALVSLRGGLFGPRPTPPPMYERLTDEMLVHRDYRQSSS